MQKEKHKRVY